MKETSGLMKQVEFADVLDDTFECTVKVNMQWQMEFAKYWKMIWVYDGRYSTCT